MVPVAPAIALEVVPMDAFRAPNAVPADYSPGSSAAAGRGRVNVNLYNPASRLLLNVEAIAYHEGLPGHHLQFSVSRWTDRPAELPPLRLLRRLLGGLGALRRAAGQGTRLLPGTPYSEYGRLQNEMWRAIRLVSIPASTASMDARADGRVLQGAHRHDDQNIQTEVDRYIAWRDKRSATGWASRKSSSSAQSAG